MPLYRYVKTYPKKRRSRFPAIISFLFMGSGILLLFWVTWPILSFQFISQDFFTHTVTPLQDSGTDVSRNTLPEVVFAATQEKERGKLDYTNPNIWFPGKPQKKVVTPVNSYKLSIPKLGIKNASVVIAGDDLKKSLIHYGGTGLPGEYGNTVIFGHSTLPQLYNPESYTTIFSLLPTLKAAKDGETGDQIFVTYDGVTYKYEVFDMHVTEPNDVSPLEQRYDDSYITLVTCVPPGTYWKRLNVVAKLIPL